jgi:hypothetical protein
MPSLMLRALSPALVDRVRTFARSRGLSLPDGAAALLDRGLQAADGEPEPNGRATTAEPGPDPYAARWARTAKIPAGKCARKFTGAEGEP